MTTLVKLIVFTARLAAGLLVTKAYAQPDRCEPGYVWREAFPGDHLCVIPMRRGCEPGYVWRESFPGDLVCVTPTERAQAASDNSQAGTRREPGGGPSGADTCRQGYLWREARPDDHVCVTPETRAQTASEKRQG